MSITWDIQNKNDFIFEFLENIKKTMPNWCFNTLEVDGDDNDIARFKDYFNNEIIGTYTSRDWGIDDWDAENKIGYSTKWVGIDSEVWIEPSKRFNVWLKVASSEFCNGYIARVVVDCGDLVEDFVDEVDRNDCMIPCKQDCQMCEDLECDPDEGCCDCDDRLWKKEFADWAYGDVEEDE